MRHPNEDDVVDAEHQHEHKSGLCQFPARTHTRRGSSFYMEVTESSVAVYGLTSGKLV